MIHHLKFLSAGSDEFDGLSTAREADIFIMCKSEIRSVPNWQSQALCCNNLTASYDNDPQGNIFLKNKYK